MEKRCLVMVAGGGWGGGGVRKGEMVKYRIKLSLNWDRRAARIKLKSRSNFA